MPFFTNPFSHFGSVLHYFTEDEFCHLLARHLGMLLMATSEAISRLFKVVHGHIVPSKLNSIAEGPYISQGEAAVELHNALKMHKPQNGLTILKNSRQEGQSLVDDKVFQVLDGAIGDDPKIELWHFISAYQDYPDPGILLRTESFARDIALSEPGKQIDYAKIRRDLATVEGDLSGSNEDKHRIFQICNKLVESHVNYVRATASVLGYELYDKLIDRFYGRLMDSKFNHFLAGKTPDIFVRSWPLYDNIKQSSMNNIRTWRQHQASASYNLEQLKSSVELKVFLAKLKTALERHEDRHRKVVPKANISDQRHRPGPQAQAQAQAVRLSRARRRASIEKRNKIIEQHRIAKNLRLKSMNLQNIHQLGDQTRICLSDYVIRALTDSQDKYQATLEENKDNGDGDGDDLHDGVQQMHIVKDGVGGDPLGGIIIPEGYVHLGSTTASGIGDGGGGY